MGEGKLDNSFVMGVQSTRRYGGLILVEIPNDYVSIFCLHCFARTCSHITTIYITHGHWRQVLMDTVYLAFVGAIRICGYFCMLSLLYTLFDIVCYMLYCTLSLVFFYIWVYKEGPFHIFLCHFLPAGTFAYNASYISV